LRLCRNSENWYTHHHSSSCNMANRGNKMMAGVRFAWG
jgi:hypothetical protein